MKRIKSENSGFTLFELVIVILIVGILAAYVGPKLRLSKFREAGFYQQAFSAIRYAQKQAVASGCTVNVSISATQCLLTWTGGVPAYCPGAGSQLTNPATGNADFCTNSATTGSPSANFTFDNIGRPSAAQNISFGSRNIIVEAETGYAHD